nr:hypothetical protein [Tanacetum cinerariifolium]
MKSSKVLPKLKLSSEISWAWNLYSSLDLHCLYLFWNYYRIGEYSFMGACEKSATIHLTYAEYFIKVVYTLEVDRVVYTREDDRVVRAATTATSLEGTGSGSGPRCQDTTLRDADAQTRFKTASKQSYDPPLSKVNKSGSGEDSIEHQDDLTNFIPPTPYDSPLSGGHTPGSDEDLVIQKLQKKVKSLENKQRARTLGMNLFKIGTSRRKSLDKENVSKQRRNFKTRRMFEEGDIDDDFDDINDMVDEAMENIEGDTVNAGSAVNTTTTGVIAASASVTTAGISISTAEPRIPPTTTTTAFDDEDFTIAQTLIKMRNEKAKEKGVAFRDVESGRPTTILPTIDPKDKDKALCKSLENLQRTQERLRLNWMKSWLRGCIKKKWLI